MIPLDYIEVKCKGNVRRIELYQGDLSNLSPADRVNFLIVSAFKQEKEVIFPIYWASADLTPHMKLLNYVDCREAETNKLTDACNTLLQYLAK